MFEYCSPITIADVVVDKTGFVGAHLGSGEFYGTLGAIVVIYLL